MPDITVIGGAGHVGIPLVLAFAEAGMTVNVNDLNEATLATLRAGKLPFIEHGAAHLAGQGAGEQSPGLHVVAKPDFAAPARSSSPSGRRLTNFSIR